MGNGNDDSPNLVSLKQPAARSRPLILECVQKLFKRARTRKVRSMLTLSVYDDGQYDVDMVIPTTDEARDHVLEALDHARERVYRGK